MTGKKDEERASPWFRRVAPIFVAALVACSAPAPEQELSTALDVARSAAHDSTRVPEAVGLLEEFIHKHSQETGVPEALMQLAILRQQQGDVDGAVQDYARIVADYPVAEAAAKAQFMIAFISEEHLRDYGAARQAYQAVIDNYPDSDLAVQARQLLAHVGEPPDAWVPGFQDEPDTGGER